MRSAGIVFLLLFFSSPAFSDTIMVPGDFPTIQAAIDAALNGDTVEVAPGTYFENIDFTGKEIVVKSRDGYAATVLDGGLPVDPDFGSVVTFQSGEGEAAVIEGFTITNGTGTLIKVGYLSHYYGGGVASYNGSAPTIRGNLITRNGVEDYGGGIYLGSEEGILPKVVENRIQTNYAGRAGGGVYGRGEIRGNIVSNHSTKYAGGGIYALSTSIIKENEIIKNFAEYSSGDTNGGGLYLRGDVACTGNLIAENESVYDGGGLCLYQFTGVLQDNVVINNVTHNKGGGIHCYSVEDAVIRHNHVLGNTAGSGGGICLSSGGITFKENEVIENHAVRGGGIAIGAVDSTVSDNLIQGNLADFGAGFYIHDSYIEKSERSPIEPPGGDGKLAAPIVMHNRVIGNRALKEGGGGYYDLYSLVTLMMEGNVFEHNTAGADGGGLRIGGARNGSICNNIFDSNQAGNDGGGLFYYSQGSTQITIANNTFHNNIARSGGGFYCRCGHEFYDLNLSNTVFWANQAQLGPSVFANQFQVHIDHSVVHKGQNSVYLYFGAALDWGEGMLVTDPLFADAEAGDLHITYNSPCRASGNNDIADLPDEDFEGDPRIAYGSIDIGADEFHPHLYPIGDASPGAVIEIKLVGLPGTVPVNLWKGAGILQTPIPTPYGDWYLREPYQWFDGLPAIPPSGIGVLMKRIPNLLPGPYSIALQGLVGDRLTNPYLIGVK